MKQDVRIPLVVLSVLSHAPIYHMIHHHIVPHLDPVVTLLHAQPPEP